MSAAANKRVRYRGASGSVSPRWTVHSLVSSVSSVLGPHGGHNIRARRPVRASRTMGNATDICPSAAVEDTHGQKQDQRAPVSATVRQPKTQCDFIGHFLQQCTRDVQCTRALRCKQQLVEMQSVYSWTLLTRLACHAAIKPINAWPCLHEPCAALCALKPQTRLFASARVLRSHAGAANHLRARMARRWKSLAGAAMAALL